MLKNLTLKLVFVIVFICSSLIARSQEFVFPKLASTSSCYFGSYTLESKLNIVGILVKDIFWDDSVANAGSFGFELLFTYNNKFTGALVDVPTFWKYQITFRSSSKSFITTNNIGTVPTTTYQSDTVHLNTSMTYIGSAKRLGLQAHTVYTDHEVLAIFGFDSATLDLLLPCMSLMIDAPALEREVLGVDMIDIEVQQFETFNRIQTSFMYNDENEQLSLQKSTDGSNWTTVMQFTDLTTSMTPQYKTYDDEAVSYKNTYYRLAITNMYDTKYSTVAVAHRNVYDSYVHHGIYPNPVVGALQLQVMKRNTTVEIYSSMGQIMFTELYKQAGTYSVPNVNSFPIGMYQILFKDENGSIQTIKFIKH